MTGRTPPSSPADRIAILLDHSAVTGEELARILALPAGVSADSVLAGEYPLSPSDLVAVADLLDVPVTVLTGQVPIDRHLGVSLRLGAVDAPDVPDDALRYADLLLRYRGLLDSLLGEQPSTRTHVSVSNHRMYKRAGQVTAQRVRHRLRLGEEPLADLVGLAEDLGFPVAFRPLPEGMHGFNVQDAREGAVTRLIVISTRGPWTLQRYTLAHEICHGLYNDDGQVIVDSVETPERLPELRADVFARHLLLPVPSLKQDVVQARDEGASWEVLTARLMVRWGMSKKAILRALEDDHLASSAEIKPVRLCLVDGLMANAGLTEQWRELSTDQEVPSGSPWLTSRALEAYGLGYAGVHVVADLLGQDIETTQEQLIAQGWGTPDPSASS
jgi:IrrE N-terminal-like domain